MTLHQLRVLPTPEAACAAAAEVIASMLDAASAADPEGRASVAFSGGSSPRPMLARLADIHMQPFADGVSISLDWPSIDVFQVDERVAPDGDTARNLVELRRQLTDSTVPAGRVHAMPVELGPEAAAEAYSATLLAVLGPVPKIDVVHLGLGDDGHTASLVPGDDALHVTDRDVATTDVYQGHRRVTLTYPMLGRAGAVVWLVLGEEKVEALAKLLSGDESIPASHVQARRSIIIADSAASPD